MTLGRNDTRFSGEGTEAQGEQMTCSRARGPWGQCKQKMSNSASFALPGCGACRQLVLEQKQHAWGPWARVLLSVKGPHLERRRVGKRSPLSRGSRPRHSHSLVGCLTREVPFCSIWRCSPLSCCVRGSPGTVTTFFIYAGWSLLSLEGLGFACELVGLAYEEFPPHYQEGG